MASWSQNTLPSLHAGDSRVKLRPATRRPGGYAARQATHQEQEGLSSPCRVGLACCIMCLRAAVRRQSPSDLSRGSHACYARKASIFGGL